MAPKNLPPAAKQAKILTWFQETSGVYTLKELEKLLPAVAAINGMQVKEYLQALQDESLIRVEKIGSGNWYWCFVSDARRGREKVLSGLRGEEEKLSAAIRDVEGEITDEMKVREDENDGDREEGSTGGGQRTTLMAAYESLVRQKEMLDGELAAYSNCDPEEMSKKMAETQRLKESTMRWTDNIEAMESFFGQVTGDRARTADLMAGACGEEYVIGEGLRDL